MLIGRCLIVLVEMNHPEVNPPSAGVHDLSLLRYFYWVILGLWPL